MDHQQLPLIPVSPSELTESAYRLAILLQESDDAEDAFAEARKEHKEHLGALRREMGDLRATIRRAQLESEEGVMSRQIESLLNHEQERS